MEQKTLSQINRRAWSYSGYYDAWCRYYGSPRTLAEDFRGEPWAALKRYRKYLGEVRGKRVANLLGSIGRKAVPLAQLGACVTVIDISEVSARYARELAGYVGVDIEYIVGDVMEVDLQRLAGQFDIVFMEGGVLHYFLDLPRFAGIIHDLLKPAGRMILGDFHPIRKCVQVVEDRARLEGDYFDRATHRSNLPLVNFLSIIEQSDVPQMRSAALDPRRDHHRLCPHRPGHRRVGGNAERNQGRPAGDVPSCRPQTRRSRWGQIIMKYSLKGIDVRPVTRKDHDRIVLRCWPEPPAIERLFETQQTIGMAAWEGDKCVGVLHCYAIAMPQWRNDDWPEWNAWWLPGFQPESAAKRDLGLNGLAWAHACCHVGRTLQAD